MVVMPNQPPTEYIPDTLIVDVPLGAPSPMPRRRRAPTQPTIRIPRESMRQLVGLEPTPSRDEQRRATQLALVASDGIEPDLAARVVERVSLAKPVRPSSPQLGVNVDALVRVATQLGVPMRAVGHGRTLVLGEATVRVPRGATLRELHVRARGLPWRTIAVRSQADLVALTMGVAL